MIKKITKCLLIKIIIITLFIILLIYYFINIFNLINYKIKKISCLNKNIIVYSKVINIDYNSNINKKDLIDILKLSKYIKKDIINNPGEYSIDNNTFIIFKRGFYFPSGYENEIILKIIFENQKIFKITDKYNNLINNFNIDPKIIYIFNNNNKEYKIFLQKKNFPSTLIDILIEIEDKRYYSHNGIDIYSIIRSLIKNIYNRKIIEGGSTITQQMVKNVFLNNKKNFLRKFNEIIISLIIEYKFDKEKILELYLNEIYFGNIEDKKIIGFPMASIYYFGKFIDKLDISEQSLLIGILKGTSLYNPFNNIDFAEKRKKIILNKIKNKKIINNELYNYLLLQKFNNKINNRYNLHFSSFIDILNKEFIKKYNNFDNYSNIKIFSTLNLRTQNNIQKAVKITINELRKIKNNNNIEVSVLIVDRKKGFIKSSIGGFNYNFSGYNRIFNNRQIGSLIKPFIYISALNIPDKYNLNTILNDNKLIIKFNNNIWIPNNPDNIFRNKITLMKALIYSLNIPTINLGISIGIDNIIKNLFKLGINKNRFINKFPSILVGAINLSLIEIAQIYQSISNYGNYIKLFSIKDILNNNNIIFTNNSEIKNVISYESSYLTLFCMKEITKIGTAKIIGKLFNNINILGKTGTTNNFRDNWFVGIDDNEICVIWIGKDNNESINNKYNGALYLYNEYLKINNPKSFNLEKSDNIYYINTDEDGNFLCNIHNDCNKIPVWIDNPNNLYNNCKHYLIFDFFKKIINFSRNDKNKKNISYKNN